MNPNIIPIFYLFSLSGFILSTFFYTPRPRLNKFLLNIEKNDQIVVKEVNRKAENLSDTIKRKINIGNSYILIIDDRVYLNITSLAFRNKEDLDLSYYAKYLPDLIIDANEILPINKNNYGIKAKTIGKKKYQACLFNFNEPSFLYKYENEVIVHRYNDFNHWGRVIKKEIVSIFDNFRQINTNCLLVTTSNLETFEDDKKNILKIILKSFSYEK